MASKVQVLREFGNLPATAEDQDEFDAQVAAGTGDRGFCLLIVAHLENELDRALEHELRPTKVERSQLFLEGGPLGNFSRKITMAGALDVVGPISLRNLTLIRHIRNAFAHAKRPIKFVTPEVAAVCADLEIINIYDPPVVMDQMPDLPARARFENVCGATMLALASLSGSVFGWTPSAGEPGDHLSTEALP
jgi:hypothetical protein